MLVLGQDRGGRLGAPAWDARDSVGGVSDQRQVVGHRHGFDTELGAYPGFVEHEVAPAIDDDDPLPLHALRQVLVRRAEPHGFDVRVGAVARRRGRQRIVGLELDHRPHHEAQRLADLLGGVELRIELGFETLPRLVTLEQIVAERFDRVVEGDADVRRPFRPHQTEHRAGKHAHRADLFPVRRLGFGRSEIGPEQLVGPVDRMHVHAAHDNEAGSALASRHSGPTERTTTLGHPSGCLKKCCNARPDPKKIWPGELQEGGRRA